MKIRARKHQIAGAAFAADGKPQNSLQRTECRGGDTVLQHYTEAAGAPPKAK